MNGLLLRTGKMQVEVIIGSAARGNGCISWRILRKTGLVWRSGFRLSVWCGRGSKSETC